MSKAEVHSHDDKYFKFWNDFNHAPKYPTHCNGNKEQSIAYCNGFSKITLSLILQIAGALAVYLLVFGKI